MDPARGRTDRDADRIPVPVVELEAERRRLVDTRAVCRSVTYRVRVRWRP